MFGFSPYTDHFSGVRRQRPRTVPTLRTQRIPHECLQRGGQLVLVFDLPGVHERDVEVSCSGGVLSVEAKKMVETWQPPYRAVVPMSTSLQLPRGLRDGHTEFSRGRLVAVFPMGESRESQQQQQQQQQQRQEEEPGCSSSDAMSVDVASESEESMKSAESAESAECEGHVEKEEVQQSAGLSAEQRQLIAASQRRLDAIAGAVQAVVTEHEDTAFRRTAASEAEVEKARKFYNELLLRQTLALDEVESHGDSEIRARRKQMISSIQRLQESVDELAAAERASSATSASEAEPPTDEAAAVTLPASPIESDE